MDASLLGVESSQYHFPPKDEDSTQENPILQNLDDLLRSPYPPSPADTQQIHSWIEKSGREMAQCDQETATEQLKLHREALSTRIERCRSLLAPIRRLPNEILESIFSMTCLSEHGRYSLRAYNAPAHEGLPHIAPTLALTHVSYRWRLLVNGSARLWSSLKLAVTARTMSRMNIVLLLGLYLARSKEHPLDLQFWQFPAYHNSFIINMIFPHISRITRLDLSTEPNSSFPPSIPDQVWDAFKTRAPRLSAIKMIRPIELFRLPYEQLTDLEIQQVHDCRDLIGLIPLCTQLHTLTFCTFPKSTRHVDKDVRIVVPSLRCLSVSVHDDKELSFISRQLGFPSLVSLDISLHEPVSFAPLVDAVSGRRLQRFVLKARCSLDTSTTELHEFLVSCPELSELRMDKWSWESQAEEVVNSKTLTYQLVEALYQAPINVAVVVPHLTELSVLEPRSSIDLATVNVLLDMMETRVAALNDNGRSKWNLGFGVSSKCKKDVLEVSNKRLESLRKRGLVCRIDEGEGYQWRPAKVT